jgi:phosphoribosylanthranilate isomerase
MATVRVKICGLTNLADARAAAAAGADALGFVFYAGSPRCIAVAEAASIVAQLPPFVTTVGVFVNATAQTILDTSQACRLDAVQLHGDESPAFCAMFPGLKVIKAFRVAQETSLDGIERYATCAWLLDSYQPGQHGGTGARFRWEWAQAAVGRGRPVILAGGLTPENVAEAVRLVRPYAVDVSSGVESSPGKKDHARMMGFVQEARRGDAF